MQRTDNRTKPALHMVSALHKPKPALSISLRFLLRAYWGLEDAWALGFGGWLVGAGHGPACRGEAGYD